MTPPKDHGHDSSVSLVAEQQHGERDPGPKPIDSSSFLEKAGAVKHQDVQLSDPAFAPSIDLNIASKDRNRQVHRLRWLALLHILFAVTITGLLIRSATNDGLWTVRLWTFVHEEESSFNELSLLWTTVPSLFFSIFLLHMNACYSNIRDLQPVFELYKGPTRGDRSVLVDYRTEWILRMVPNAWRRGHFLVSLTAVLSLAFSIAVVPLSAHLLETRHRQSITDGLALQITDFNMGLLSQQADYSRAFDITSAQEIYGGGRNLFSRWMDRNHSFPTFKASSSPWPYNSTITISSVTGYYADLKSCRFVNVTDYLLITNGSASADGSKPVSLTATDDGCLIKHTFSVTPNKYSLYMETGSTGCASADRSVNQTRAFFLMAWPEPGMNSTAPLALSTRLIACTPEYGQRVGSLEVAVDDGTIVRSFDLNDDTSKRCCTSNGESPWNQTSAMESAIMDSRILSSSAKISSTSIGNLVLNHFDVNRRNTSTPWEVNDANTEQDFRRDILNSIQIIFRSVALTAIATLGFEHPEWPLDLERTSVTITRDVERLHVVPWVAIIIIVVISASFGLTLRAETMSRRMREYDVDLPSNMMDYYGLLHGCKELEDMAARVDGTNHDGRFADRAKSQWTLEAAKFWIVKDRCARRLRVDDLEQKQ